MLVYAIFVTFMLGLLLGSVITITISVKMEDRRYQRTLDAELEKMSTPQGATILNYDKK